MKHAPPYILLVNPWIHDFAAYDVWAKPIGLLTIAGILRFHGCTVSYIDCLDRFHPRSQKKSDPFTRHGRGPYPKTPIPKPAGLESIPRTYSRYGILPEWLMADLKILPRPDLILVTSMMTYWYPGVFEAIRMIRTVYPDIPVVLGGIYATLCHDHAVAYSGADLVVAGPGEKKILDLVEDMLGVSFPLGFDPDNLDTYPYPAFDLQRKTGYIPLVTSRGCPFSCDYCASNVLAPVRMTRNPEKVVEEIFFWQDNFGVRDFAFYDDALLVNPEHHAIPMFEAIAASGRTVYFHTPNAVHIREITPRMAALMFRAGVKHLRLGLETSDFEGRDMDRKVREAEFLAAAAHLLAAGFTKDQVGAYLLVGLPGQSLSSVARSIETVKQSGISPVLTYYTPIPHTRMWEAAKAASRYDLAADPVFTNNAVMPCRPAGFDWQEQARLKKLVKGVVAGVQAEGLDESGHL
ncbi:MAG: radical SAM protein [Desulfobacteraceae bacterium]|nr:radical SAM protein [Desulfobacteraceae bacterium]